MNECPPGKIRNPRTGHCVKKTGRTARSIIPRNANGARLFNVVSQEYIPSWAHVYESNQGPYDVRSLANMIDHAGAESPKFPLGTRREMTDNERIEIMARARQLRWRPKQSPQPAAPGFAPPPAPVPSPFVTPPPGLDFQSAALGELQRRGALERMTVQNMLRSMTSRRTSSDEENDLADFYRDMNR